MPRVDAGGIEAMCGRGGGAEVLEEGAATKNTATMSGLVAHRHTMSVGCVLSRCGACEGEESGVAGMELVGWGGGRGSCRFDWCSEEEQCKADKSAACCVGKKSGACGGRRHTWGKRGGVEGRKGGGVEGRVGDALVRVCSTH